MVLQVWHWWLIFSYFISGIDGIEIIFSNLHLSLWGRWLQLRCHGNNLPRFPTHHSDRMRGTSRSLRTPRSSPKWSRCLCRNGTPWWQSGHRCTPAGDKPHPHPLPATRCRRWCPTGRNSSPPLALHSSWKIRQGEPRIGLDTKINHRIDWFGLDSFSSTTFGN